MKIALGSAQFGMKYGVANKSREFQLSEIKKVLKIAEQAGIDTIDTAINYGQSESNLGKAGVDNWKIITKIQGLHFDNDEPYDWTLKQIESSLNNLQKDSLEAVLLHDSSILKVDSGELVFKALEELKSQKIINKIGVSIYSPKELEGLYDRFNLDIIQSPFNILDRRISKSGWLKKIQKDRKELHIRSLFLQGLLLFNQSSRPMTFNNWEDLWISWDNWLEENKLTPLEACLMAIYDNPGIKKIIIGIDNLSQLEQILSVIKTGKFVDLPLDVFSDDENLINPSNWQYL